MRYIDLWPTDAWATHVLLVSLVYFDKLEWEIHTNYINYIKV